MFEASVVFLYQFIGEPVGRLGDIDWPLFPRSVQRGERRKMVLLQSFRDCGVADASEG